MAKIELLSKIIEMESDLKVWGEDLSALRKELMKGSVSEQIAAGRLNATKEMLKRKYCL